MRNNDDPSPPKPSREQDVKLSFVRVAAQLMGVGAAVALAVYLYPNKCTASSTGVGLSATSAVFGVVAVCWSGYDAVLGKDHRSRSYIQELLSIAACVFFYLGVIYAYEIRFDAKCMATASSHPHMLRESMTLLAVLQTLGTMAYAARAEKRLSGLSILVGVVSAGCAVGSVVAFYVHGGKTVPCVALMAGGSKALSSDANAENEALYTGIIYMILVSSITMVTGYYLERISWPQTATYCFIVAGTVTSIVTYFFMVILVEDREGTCPFVLNQEHKDAGNASMYLVVFAMALQHVVPISSSSQVAERVSNSLALKPLGQRNSTATFL